MNAPKYSIIIPVYNRPDEVQELLESLTKQDYKNFEVLIIEDGSAMRCDNVVSQYQSRLDLHYYFKPNEGPGPTRNFGYAKAHGDYFVVFDSDCIIPPSYFSAVEQALQQYKLDAWGGPDRAHAAFTLSQRAMGYTMSSFLTTGGIRGGKKRVGWFQPRSFNMGISRKVFETTGGFHFDRYAEDIEFSIRMRNTGFRVGLIAEAFVFHKRRATFGEFYNQVFNFGKGRALIGRKYPEEVKLAHWFPAIFTFGLLIVLFLPFISAPLAWLGFLGFGTYLMAIFTHSLFISKNLWVAILSIPASLLQLCGYGIGFFQERVKTYFLK